MKKVYSLQSAAVSKIIKPSNNLTINNQKGQVVIILLLVVVIALAVGLSIAGRSTTEIATAVKTEDSSRALSAAEAGLERALQQQNLQAGSLIVQTDLSNQSEAEVSWDRTLPLLNNGLEYPPFSRDSFAQFWLADLRQSTLPKFYDQNSFDIYFGTPGQQLNSDDNPAIEVHVVVYNQTSGVYESRRSFYDSYNIGSQSTRNTDLAGCGSFSSSSKIATNSSASADRSFYCQVTVPYRAAGEAVYPILVRVKLLYTNSPQPVALIHSASSGNCGQACSLPPQMSVFTSQGTSGDTRRDIQVFQQKQVVPFFFDYALFSAGDLQK